MKEPMNRTTGHKTAESPVNEGPWRGTELARRLALPCALVAVVLLAAGCTSRYRNNAPVEDRDTGLSRPVPVAVDPGNVKPLPGFENAGKAGYYTVKPGDTMIRIGLENGQNWRDIVHWNKLENPNIIEVGQVFRVVPPTGDNPLVVTRPVSSGASLPAPVQAASSARPEPAQPPSPPAANGDENVTWIWPAQGM